MKEVIPMTRVFVTLACIWVWFLFGWGAWQLATASGAVCEPPSCISFEGDVKTPPPFVVSLAGDVKPLPWRLQNPVAGKPAGW